MLLFRAPAACTATPQRPHARHVACAMRTTATSSQRSQLGRPACRSFCGSHVSTACSSLSAASTTVNSPCTPPAAAAIVTAATLQCRMRRRRRTPFSSKPHARRKRDLPAQQQCRCLVDATALPLTAPQQQQQPKLRVLPAASQTVIRPAEPSDYWAIADMHCEAFYPREPPGLMHTLLRLDRVLALVAGRHTATKSQERRFCCLVACRGQPPSSSSNQISRQHSRHHSRQSSNSGSSPGEGRAGLATAAQRWQEGFLSSYWAAWRAIIPGPITAGLGADFGEKGIVGVAVIDTLGDHTPPVRTAGGGKRRRPRLAYVSNLAVAAGARRRGIGAVLMQQAERMAAEWGATALMLHVDASNDAATKLYRRQRYKLLAEPLRSWVAKAVDVHAGKRMMMKRLPGATGISSRRSDKASQGSDTHTGRMLQGHKH